MNKERLLTEIFIQLSTATQPHTTENGWWLIEKGRFNSACRAHKENGFKRISAARVFTHNVHMLHSETERQGWIVPTQPKYKLKSFAF